MSRFICPNCYGQSATSYMSVSPELGEGPPSPWKAILQRIKCDDCCYIIPAHLGERWNDLSLEDARRQWFEVYWQETRNEEAKQ